VIILKTVYVYESGAIIKKAGDRISVQKDGMLLSSEPLINVSAVALLDTAQVTSQAMVALIEAGIPVFYMKKSGRILGTVHPNADKNVFLRLAQYDAWKDESLRCKLARSFILSKIDSQKKVINKYRSREFALCAKLIQSLDEISRQLETSQDIYVIMGLEGASTNCYYDLLRECFTGMPFDKRTKHPPRDEVNSLLSLGYTLLLSRVQASLLLRGFDTGIGYLHSIQANRDSLGLDMIEVYRPHIDNMVMNCVNRREFTEKDFQETNNAVKILSKDGFRRFVSKLSAMEMVLVDIPRYVDWLFAALMSGKEVVPWLLE